MTINHTPPTFATMFPKKRFGQHFLKDKHIAERVCGALTGFGEDFSDVLEIGPGMGSLTQFLYPQYGGHLYLVEIDKELAQGLKEKYPHIKANIFEEDFLEMELGEIFKKPFAIIGNFP